MDSVVRVTPAKIVLGAAAAVSDAQFRAWLRKVMTTTLDRRARQAPTGQLIRAVDAALSEDDARFALTNGFWHLKSDDREPSWSESLAPLVAEAWRVETDINRFPVSPSAPLLAQRRDTRAVAEAVLEMSGPLRKVDLTEVLASRFNTAFDVKETPVEAGDGVEIVLPADEAEFEDFDDATAAAWMESQLLDEERQVLVLRLEGMSLRDLAEELGTKHRAETLVNRVESVLGRLASHLPDGGVGATARLLRNLGPEAHLGDSLGQDGHDDGF